ncbi:MAG: hypothetical protein HWD86_06665 [Kangiellaceae bacterium]|nr:hypothetical protein [Kangiellaceae bacterium]
MEAQQLLQNIEAMIADKSCQQVSDCDLLPVGARPCGGPDSYLPYAPNKVSDPKVLSALNQAYKKKIQDYFAENQIMGICVATPKPSVACQQNQCVALEQNLQIQ